MKTKTITLSIIDKLMSFELLEYGDRGPSEREANQKFKKQARLTELGYSPSDFQSGTGSEKPKLLGKEKTQVQIALSQTAPNPSCKAKIDEESAFINARKKRVLKNKETEVAQTLDIEKQPYTKASGDLGRAY